MLRTIYLAGPEVFLPDPEAVAEEKKAICRRYGFDGKFPFDVEIDRERTPKHLIGLEISRSNEQLIRECDLLIANITPFRGPSADVGTAFEMGLMRALGRPVLAYSNCTESFVDRTMRFLHRPLPPHLPPGGRPTDDRGMAIENHGYTDNLMLEGAVVLSGGTVVRIEVNDADLYSNVRGFEKCVEQAAQLRTALST